MLPLNHLGDVLIPTMFGAELFVPTDMADSLQDIGATPGPILDSIAAVDELRMPDCRMATCPTLPRSCARGVRGLRTG